ncbi:MAG: hypothetical protein JW807_16640 [Spirochaetes bacterium]|nr:hypothetical protein [Spirochaetota bacterium]
MSNITIDEIIKALPTLTAPEIDRLLEELEKLVSPDVSPTVQSIRRGMRAKRGKSSKGAGAIAEGIRLVRGGRD